MNLEPVDQTPSVEAIRFAADHLLLIDQRLLPVEQRWLRYDSAAGAAEAIRDMVVRGAPAIGVTAAYGLALDALHGRDLVRARATLAASRPTAVNLQWAIDRMSAVGTDPAALVREARAIHAEDIAINRAMGAHGAALLGSPRDVYHHCNTGALATGGWGTALGVVRSLAAAGRAPHVWVGETRPYLQGARLTAWELQQEGIPCTLVTDSTAATLFAAGRIEAVLVGCDRVANNGDTANKTGTLMLAVLARHYGVPLYVCMPTSTLDRRCPDGSAIPIEGRGAEEVVGYRGHRWAADVPVFNPAFDVTPAPLVTAWITERGIWRPPFPE